MFCIRVGRRHTFYRALDLLTACACTDLSAGASTTALPNAVRLSRPALDSKLCRLGKQRMKLRTTPLLPLLSLAPLRDLVAVMAPMRDPVAVLSLLHRRATCKMPSPPLEDDEYGSKIFENLGVQDITPEHVKSVGDLLVLRSYFLTHLGPRLGWLIKLSVTEWSTLSAEEKRVHTAMRRTFLKSYVFGAEAIIQHWFWKTLKTATKSFGPLSERVLTGL